MAHHAGLCGAAVPSDADNFFQKVAPCLQAILGHLHLLQFSCELLNLLLLVLIRCLCTQIIAVNTALPGMLLCISATVR